MSAAFPYITWASSVVAMAAAIYAVCRVRGVEHREWRRLMSRPLISPSQIRWPLERKPSDGPSGESQDNTFGGMWRELASDSIKRGHDLASENITLRNLVTRHARGTSVHFDTLFDEYCASSAARSA